MKTSRRQSSLSSADSLGLGMRHGLTGTPTSKNRGVFAETPIGPGTRMAERWVTVIPTPARNRSYPI